MSTEPLHDVTVVFKEGLTRNANYEVLHLRMTAQERQRLCDSFSSTNTYTGVYDVVTDHGPRLLAIRFADVLCVL